MTRLTEAQLAERWDVTQRTLQNWRKARTGPAFVKIGPKSIFYRIQDVEAYEEECTINKRPGWKSTIKRAAGALSLLADKAAKPEVKKTLEGLRDELHGLL